MLNLLDALIEIGTWAIFLMIVLAALGGLAYGLWMGGILAYVLYVIGSIFVFAALRQFMSRRIANRISDPRTFGH